VSERKVIYDAKHDRIYEGWFSVFNERWHLYYEDHEAIIKARTKPGAKLNRGRIQVVGSV
jgi:hypothetical protein